jgi:Cu/Ag efflux pump CusA
LLYMNFRRLTETLIVMLSLPFALVGGIWLMWWLGFNPSVAVAVGFIALAGVAAETGVVSRSRSLPALLACRRVRVSEPLLLLTGANGVRSRKPRIHKEAAMNADASSLMRA